MAMTIFPRLLAWSLAAAVAFATLGPPNYRPHTEFGQNAEHALAFVLVGAAFGLAYTRNRLLTALIGVAMASLVELLQFWAPGRHARLMDFLVDALAACANCCATAVLGSDIPSARVERTLHQAGSSAGGRPTGVSSSGSSRISSNSTILSISAPIAMLVTRSRMNSTTTGTLYSAIHSRAVANAACASCGSVTRIALQPRPFATATWSTP